MKDFFTNAPGVVWTALIVGLMLLAEWLTQYFGNVAWVAPVAGLLAAVIVPILKVLAGNATAGEGARDVYEMTASRSAFQRWLL